MDELIKRVTEYYESNVRQTLSDVKRQQVGSGMRGDKIRTLRFQDNTVTDHNTGKKMTADKYIKGYMDELWI